MMKQVVCLALLFSLFLGQISAQCTSVPFSTTLTDNSGSFGCTNAGNNANSLWTIRPQNGSIFLSFDLLELEGFPWDYITIYDGSLVIDVHDDSPTSYTSFSDEVVVQYTSDPINPSSFSISYVALGNPCLYSVHRDINDNVLTCTSLAVVSSSWTIHNNLPIRFYFTIGDEDIATVVVRDGSSSGPIIYNSANPRSGFTNTSPVLYSVEPEIYVSVVSTGNTFFQLQTFDYDYCSTDNVYLTSESGTLSCTGAFTTGTFNDITIDPGYGIIEFTFDSFFLDGDDILLIYDLNGFSLSLSGTSLPAASYVSFTTPVFISYYSIDGTLQYTINYRTLSSPCVTPDAVATLTENTGVFGCSNNVIGNYTSGFLIQPQNGGAVTLTFPFLGGNTALNFYDGTSSNDGLLGSYKPYYFEDGYSVGGLSVFPVVSSGPMFIELLSSDFDTTNFQGSYTTAVLANPCITSTTIERLALFGTVACTNIASGVNLHSFWEIVPSHGVITIQFTDFNLEPNTATLTFYDDVNDRTLIQSFTAASTVPKSFTSSSSSVVVELEVTANKKRAAPYSFSFTYSAAASPCDLSTEVVLLSPSGTFGCPNGFASNIYSTWLIAPHNGVVQYNFDIFQFWYYLRGTFINIYDGYDNTGILLQSLYPSDTYYDQYLWYGDGISGTSISDAIFVELISDELYNFSYDMLFEISYFTLGDVCGTSGAVTLTEPKGVFGCATGLNNNIQSSWLISPENTLISLVFLQLDLENGFDYLEIYDGNSTTSPLLANITGNVIPLPNAFYSTADTLLVIVYTDSAITSGGFQMAYTSGLGNPCLSDYNQTLTSSVGEFGCANGIQNSIHSYWTISVPLAQGVIIASFTEFSLELDNDFLYVYDGDSDDATLLATLTGSNLPDDITSTGQNLFFLLVTSNTTRSQGFYVKYTSVESDPCLSNQLVTLTKNADSFGCTEGTIANGLTSSWQISPNNGNIITLTFSVFNLRAGDFVRVYDGTTTAANLLGAFTGGSLPNFLVSTGGHMLVVLSTDAVTPSVGFRASYTTNTVDPCVTSTEVTIVTASGSFGCANGVRNNVRSSWLIAPLSNNKLELTVEFLDLQVNDILYIYDGSSSDYSPLLGSLTGQSRGTVFTTTNSVALIVVDTDGSLESNGFVIDFVTAIPPTPSHRPVAVSATRSPIDFSFTASVSPIPVSASQTPITLTPFIQAVSPSKSVTTLPSASPIVPSVGPSSSFVPPSVTFSFVPSPSPPLVPASASPSTVPAFSIVPFSPSANPSATSTTNPVRVISDVESLTVELECLTSGATCCNNFETVWASEIEENYPTLIDVASCVFNDGIVTVKFDQYGSNHFTVEEILRTYWDEGGCERLDPLSGDECSVSTSSLDTNIWNTRIMAVDSVPPTPSPLPSYYYYYVSSTSGSSILSAMTSILFVALTAVYLAL